MDADVNANATPPAPEKVPARRRLTAGLRRGLSALWRPIRELRYEFFIVSFFALVGLIFLFPAIYHTIPAGHVGVLWSRFSGGTQTDKLIPEGFRLTLPWDNLYVYDARIQKVEQSVKALSSDGLEITMNLVWRYRLQPGQVGLLHKYIGPDYSETLITPTVSARARDIIAIYRPEEVYTESRLRIQGQILCAARDDILRNFNIPEKDRRDARNASAGTESAAPASANLSKSDCLEPGVTNVGWIDLEDVVIKGMSLPPGVQEAIVRKNAMFHEMEEYSFRLEREQKEAERKRIEAVGIRNFQEIVSNGMTDAYLQWRGIEATLELAKSNNAKVVVVGGGKQGMPLILNPDAHEAPAKPAGGK